MDHLLVPRGAKELTYYSGPLERQWPIPMPAVAIEHENYGLENVCAAVLRVIGVAAGLHVVIYWPIKHSHQAVGARIASLLRERSKLSAASPETPLLLMGFDQEWHDDRELATCSADEFRVVGRGVRQKCVIRSSECLP